MSPAIEEPPRCLTTDTLQPQTPNNIAVLFERTPSAVMALIDTVAADGSPKRNNELYLGPAMNFYTTVCVYPNALSNAIYIHRSILCHFSPYFRSQLQQPWAPPAAKNLQTKSGVEVCVKLPSVMTSIKLPKDLATTEEVFSIFVRWMYTSTFSDTFGSSPDAGLLIQLWVFAHRIEVPECQNTCIEEVEKHRQHTNAIQTEWIPWVYCNTKDGCAIRKLLVDQCTFLNKDWFRIHEEQFPQKFLLDYAYRMRELQMQSQDCPLLTGEGRKKAYHNLSVHDKRPARQLLGT